MVNLSVLLDYRMSDYCILNGQSCTWIKRRTSYEERVGFVPCINTITHGKFLAVWNFKDQPIKSKLKTFLELRSKLNYMFLQVSVTVFSTESVLRSNHHSSGSPSDMYNPWWQKLKNTKFINKWPAETGKTYSKHM